MDVREPRCLVVLRHAKSAWPEGVADRDRPLGPRGLCDAPAAGRWLRENGIAPDHVVCSPARRTRETWQLVAGELATVPPVAFDERVYGASASELLDVLRDVPAQARTVLLVGHAPGVQDLTLGLAAAGEGDTVERAAEKFPTSAIAVLSTTGDWSGLTPGCAHLSAFAVPRGRKP